MGIHIQWDDVDESIVVMQFDEYWHLDEFIAHIQTIWAWIGSKNYPVDVIVDMSRTKSSPARVMPTMARMQSSTPPNLGMVVGVGMTGILRVVAELLERVAPKMTANNVMVNTLEEARARIAAQRGKAKS